MTEVTDHYFATWAEAQRAAEFVQETWPEAVHSGVGYWRIPRKARIFYTGNPEDPTRGVARLRYEPMR